MSLNNAFSIMHQKEKFHTPNTSAKTWFVAGSQLN